MAESFKICPICDARNHKNAVICNTCGTSLVNIEPITRSVVRARQQEPAYDFRHGETDLLESSLAGPARSFLMVGCVALIAFLIGGGTVLVGTGYLLADDAADNTPAPDATGTRPPLNVVTVTTGPPTATMTFTPPPTFTPSITPTRTPCIQRIVQGDSLIGAIARCGHTSRDVIDEVVEINNLADANSIRVGQDLVIPWPTPTTDPAALPTAAPESGSNSSGSSVADEQFALNEDLDAFAPTMTPTLPPGVMWHRVQPDDNITTIIIAYNANVRTISELNPEMDFAQCEFGVTFGGEDCKVNVFVGQQIRVPAPTPTATLSPTPDPNATATPTATATYNQPQAISPADRTFFAVNDLVTLRWIPSATLNADEAYRVDVTDTTTGLTYTALTRDIAFILPADWQGRAADRHEYTWQVGIVNQATPEDVNYQTAARTFVWQGVVNRDSED